MPFLGSVLRGWAVCGRPVRVAQGMMTSVYRVAGLYEARQAWLDRQGYGEGMRALCEACWREADADLEADIEDMVAESMKRDS